MSKPNEDSDLEEGEIIIKEVHIANLKLLLYHFRSVPIHPVQTLKSPLLPVKQGKRHSLNTSINHTIRTQMKKQEASIPKNIEISLLL